MCSPFVRYDPQIKEGNFEDFAFEDEVEDDFESPLDDTDKYIFWAKSMEGTIRTRANKTPS